MTTTGPVRVGIDAHLLSFAQSYRQAGVSRYIAELLRALATEEGARQYQYIAFTGRSPIPSDFLDHVRPRLQWVHSRLATERAPVRIAWEQLAGPIAARREGLALFHGPVNIVPLALPCRSIITIHDLAFLAHPGTFHAAKRRYLALLTRVSARRARLIIAVSAFTRDEIVRRLAVPPKKVRVVHNAVDPLFAPLPQSEIARFRAAQRVAEQTILAVGTLEPRKNLTLLLEAFARLTPRTTAELVIVGGQGWLYQEVLRRVAALGLSGRVRFVGFAPDETLVQWYNAATIFVYPSRYEGFGLPVLEALACGTPTITSDGTAMAEIASDAALLVDPDDPAALAARIECLLADQGLRNSLRERGLRQAARFTWAATAGATRAVYDEAVAP